MRITLFKYNAAVGIVYVHVALVLVCFVMANCCNKQYNDYLQLKAAQKVSLLTTLEMRKINILS